MAQAILGLKAAYEKAGGRDHTEQIIAAFGVDVRPRLVRMTPAKAIRR
jgi:hypothetical protein